MCRFSRCVLIAFVACSWTACLYAQQIEEIIVTAQKRSQDIRDVPFGMSAMDDETVAETLLHGVDVLALASRLPSLYVESSNGVLAPRFYIRGIGNVDFDLNASQPVSLVYDEVVLENPTAKAFPLFDIERVEVLRGPQGTLFGRNTTAGIVKFDSFKPSDQEETKTTVSLGRFGYHGLSGVLNRPLIASNAKVRFSYQYNRQGNWIDNIAPGFEGSDVLGGFEDYAVRFQVAWDDAEAIEALLNIHARSLKNATPTLFRGNAIKQGSNDFVRGFKRDAVSIDAQHSYEQEASQVGVVLKLDYAAPNFDVVSITGIHSVLNSLSRGDIDGGYGSVFANVLPSGPGVGIPFDAQTADGIPEHLQWSQEIRIEGERTGNEWILGAYVFREDFDIETFNYATIVVPNPVNGYVHQNQKTRSWALFGTSELINRDRFTVSAGARLSSDAKEFVAERTMSPLSFLGVGPTDSLSVDPSAQVLTWDLNSLYRQSESVNWYARLASSYRAPSIQGRLLFQDEISVADEEQGLSFEFGIKSVLMDRRLRFNATAYTYAIDDFQLTKIGGSGNINTLINANQLRGQGLEVDLEFFLTEAWVLYAGLSRNATEINDSMLSVNGCGSANLLYGCTVVDPQLANGEFLIAGNSLYNSPELMFQWAFRYEKRLHNGTFSFVTDWIANDGMRFTLYDSLEHSDDGVKIGGVRLSYVTNSEKQRISLYVRNLTDDLSMIGGIDFNNLTAMINAPRVWGFEWQYET